METIDTSTKNKIKRQIVNRVIHISEISKLDLALTIESDFYEELDNLDLSSNEIIDIIDELIENEILYVDDKELIQYNIQHEDDKKIAKSIRKNIPQESQKPVKIELSLVASIVDFNKNLEELHQNLCMIFDPNKNYNTKNLNTTIRGNLIKGVNFKITLQEYNVLIRSTEYLDESNLNSIRTTDIFRRYLISEDTSTLSAHPNKNEVRIELEENLRTNNFPFAVFYLSGISGTVRIIYDKINEEILRMDKESSLAIKIIELEYL